MRGPVPEEVASREKSSEPRAGGGGLEPRIPQARSKEPQARSKEPPARPLFVLIRDRRAARNDPSVPAFSFLLGQVHYAPPPASPLSFVVRDFFQSEGGLGD